MNRPKMPAPVRELNIILGLSSKDGPSFLEKLEQILIKISDEKLRSHRKPFLILLLLSSVIRRDSYVHKFGVA